MTGTFAGNTGTSPQLLPSSGHNNFVITPAPTTATYTGATTATNGSSVTLSSTLTSNGTPLSGQPLTLTLGTGRTAQSCTATTSSSGAASCSIPSVNQVAGSVTVTVSYAGNGSYQSSSTSSTVKVSNCGGSGGGSGGSGGGSGGYGGGYTEPPPVGGGRELRLILLTAGRRPELQATRALLEREGRDPAGVPFTVLLQGWAIISTVPATNREERAPAAATRRPARDMAVASRAQSRPASGTVRHGRRRRAADLQPLLRRPQHPFAHERQGGEDGQPPEDPALPERIGPLAHGNQARSSEHGDAVDRAARPVDPGPEVAPQRALAAAATTRGDGGGDRPWRPPSPSSRAPRRRSPRGAGARCRRPLRPAGDAWPTCSPMTGHQGERSATVAVSWVAEPVP